jgi:hypothetical protein
MVMFQLGASPEGTQREAVGTNPGAPVNQEFINPPATKIGQGLKWLVVKGIL